MASFTPQLSAPAVTNKWYLHTSKGGYNNSILVASPSVLPNCVGYARGRFSEICGSWQDTPNVDGGNVYGNATKFSRGKAPKLGAIICWSKPGHAGHVAVVEKINRDSSGKVVSITTSESGYKSVSYSSIVSNGKYNSSAFWTGTYYASKNYCFGSYQFQGFVYNPGVTTEDNLTDSSTVTGSVERLYDGQDLNDSQDASMREICYMDNRSEPSISMSNIKLSMINYTSTLAAIFNIMIRPNVTGYASQDVVLDKIGSVPRQIIQYFVDKGLPAAAGVGIAANVQGECGFDIGQTVMDSNGLYSYGMCMWNGSNGTAMTKYVGSNWRTNLTGQCNFLWYDMTSRQPSWFQYMMNAKLGKNMTIVEGLKSVPNTLAGAKTAADMFVRVYENPGDPDGGSKKRQGFAEDIWSKIIS